MIGPILGGAAATPPIPWRMLRLGSSQQGGVWQDNTSPVRVSSASQDAEGWITLDLENPSPIGGTPDVSAWLSWPILDSSGLPFDTSTLGTTKVLLFLLQRDTTGWAGSAAGELVGLGVVDNDGDPTAGGSGLLIGISTPAAAADYTLIAATLASANSQSNVPGSRLAGYAIVTPTQHIVSFAGGQDQAGNVVNGTETLALSSHTGAQRICMIASCASTANNGPHAVRFRAWYAPLSTGSLPWSPA